MAQQPDFLDLAEANGWAVFAADPGKKFACSPDWCEIAKAPDYDYLRQKRAEGHNIGWAMGEQPSGEVLVALDVEAPFVEKFYQEWEQEYGPGPATYAQQSKSGGLHLVYRGDVPSTKLRLGGQIIGDVVAHGKQILAAGSVVDGRPYVLLGADPIAALPPRWHLAVAKPERDHSSVPPEIWRQDDEAIRRATEYLQEAPPSVSGQGGHNALLLAAIHVVKALQVEPSIAETLLLDVYNPRCDPPWAAFEVAHKVQEVLSGNAGGNVEWGQEWLRVRPDGSRAPDPLPPTLPSGGFFARIQARELAEPLPKLVYTADALQLAPGAVTLIAGYGFSGKTYVAQNLALGIALGAPVFGGATSVGRVLHLDFEQGRRVTTERYQRLAAGFGRSLVEAQLDVVVYPPIYLSHERASEVLMKETEGHALCIVDSLRACAPDLDENSSEIRQVLDTMNLVSEKTGCAFVVIHHAGKTQESARQALRGSSAIYDSAANVFLLEKEEDGPIYVRQTKARLTGTPEPTFTLAFEELAPTGLGSLAGIRLVRGEPESRSAREGAEMRAALNRIAEAPEGLTLRQMQMVAPKGLLDELEQAGKIVKEGQLYKKGPNP